MANGKKRGEFNENNATLKIQNAELYVCGKEGRGEGFAPRRSRVGSSSVDYGESARGVNLSLRAPIVKKVNWTVCIYTQISAIARLESSASVNPRTFFAANPPSRVVRKRPSFFRVRAKRTILRRHSSFGANLTNHQIAGRQLSSRTVNVANINSRVRDLCAISRARTDRVYRVRNSLREF